MLLRFLKSPLVATVVEIGALVVEIVATIVIDELLDEFDGEDD